MSGKLEKTLNNIHGCPTEAETTTLNIISTTTSGQLEANQIYRAVATEDCYFTLLDWGSGDLPVTSGGCYLPADTIDYFSTTGREDGISVLRLSNNGVLHLTKMKSR